MARFTLMQILSAEALPYPEAASLQRSGALISRNDNGNHTMTMGERPGTRTIFTVLSLFCTIVLSLLLGSRFSRLRRNAMMQRNITSVLVLVMYFFVMSFIICAAVMLTGQGLYSYRLCFSATWICLILYTFSKLVIYIFLVERIHVVRAPFFRRSRDWIYLSCMALMILSFGAVAVNAYLSPIIEINDFDGRCHMGIPGKASIPFMTADITVDVVLTGIFFYLLRPVIEFRGLSGVSILYGADRSKNKMTADSKRRETAVQRNIRILLWKSLIGSMLIMIPTVANMIQFYITKGRELALICLTLCVVDVSWDAVVIHWLTFGSAEAESNLTRLTVRSTRTPLTSCTSGTSQRNRDTRPENLSLPEEPLDPPPSAHTPNAPYRFCAEYAQKDESTECVLPRKPI